MVKVITRTGIKTTSFITLVFLFIASMILLSGCGEEKIIVREIIYRGLPEPVELISPANDSLLSSQNPTFGWNSQDDAINYEIQVSSSSTFINFTINTSTVNTTYTTISEISNGSYYWRIRSQNSDSMWGDWSDASIRLFYKSDTIFYMNLLSSIHTIGTAQDVLIRGDTAYIADGQSELTLINVVDKSNPYIDGTFDRLDDDFAKGLFIAEMDTFPYVWIADMDGHVKGINLRDSTGLYDVPPFGDQNIEDIAGKVINDTLRLFSVRSRSGKLAWVPVIYDPTPIVFNSVEISFPTDLMGIFIHGDLILLACDVGGLGIVDISDISNPQPYVMFDLPGLSLSITARGDYAYMATDRYGLYVIDLTAGPDTVSHVNTSGRTKDVHLVGDHAFIADGSGGVKIIDISMPDSAYFVAAYDTPYAYGIWADTEYIYVCDRDEGLMIFENLVSE